MKLLVISINKKQMKGLNELFVVGWMLFGLYKSCDY